jgi:DNA-binding transcriptional LysR family regulator
VAFSVVELQVLAGLAEGKTLSDIAERANFSQPAISKVLRAAERQAGLPLVERRGRRLELTLAGHEICEAARAIVAQMDGLETLAGDLRGGARGTLRMVASLTPANYVLPGALSLFLARAPGVDLIVEMPFERDWRTFLRPGLDLAVTLSLDFGSLDEIRSGWIAERLYEEEVVFTVAPSSHLAGRTLHPAELRDELFIGSFSTMFWMRILRPLFDQGLEVNRRIDVDGAEIVKQLAAAGHGIGIHFGSSVWEFVRDKRLVPLSINGLSQREPCYLIRPKAEHPLKLADEFVRCLHEQIELMFPP